MKKVLILFIMLLLLTSCTYKENKTDEGVHIITSFYPVYIATANIVDGVEGVTLTNLTSSEVGCLHDYQLTTANLMAIEKSDIFIINGGGMENFVQKVIDNCKDLKIINSSDGIVEQNFEDSEQEQNSHIWVSISLYEKQVENICSELMKLDAKNAELYEKNKEKYMEKLEILKNEMHQELDNLQYRNIVTFHEAFEFFAREFNLNVVAVIEREPGTYPSAGELADTIRTIQKTDAKAIFVEPQYSKTVADTISKETGVPVYQLDPVVTGDLQKDAYEKTMRENLKNLVKALED